MQLLLATRNKDKLKELRTLLKDLPLEVVSASEIRGLPEVEEDAPTVRDNAAKKAVEVAREAKKLTLADDTGLEVDALHGAPGVRSARFAGDGATYHENICPVPANPATNVTLFSSIARRTFFCPSFLATALIMRLDSTLVFIIFTNFFFDAFRSSFLISPPKEQASTHR